MTHKQEVQEQAAARLREVLNPGDTVYTILRHVSRSGMMRTIQLVRFKDGKPYYLGYNAAEAMGYGYDCEREGVKVRGCGMDMGFHLIYELGRELWPDDPESGYALKHCWL